MEHRRLWAEIDLDAISMNASRLASLVHPSRVMAIVKADAYGHGMVPASLAIARAGVSDFGVATMVEGLALRAVLPSDCRIAILSPLQVGQEPKAVSSRLAPFVSNSAALERLSSAGRAAGAKAPLHVEIDTGMGRTGALVEDGACLWRAALRSPELDLQGVCTHLAAADTHPEFTRAQVAAFAGATAGLPPGVPRHAAASAGIIGYPSAWFDMVRPGMLVYGLQPRTPTPLAGLTAALELKCAVGLVRDLPAGWPIGYGSTVRLTRRSRLAVLPVGYGDGYPRLLSNKGHVLLGGRRRPILGTVCMDLTMVDVTDDPQVECGDIAVLIGRQGSERISAEEIAHAIGTTEHEITTRLMPRTVRLHLTATPA